MTHPRKKGMRSVMRKKYIALGVLMLVNSVPTYIPMTPHAQQEIPAYAKWGKLAIKETQSKYPNAKIIDYLHEGSQPQGNLTIEKFKLWLKDEDKEFGVFVRITYITETEKVVTLELRETPR